MLATSQDVYLPSHKVCPQASIASRCFGRVSLTRNKNRRPRANSTATQFSTPTRPAASLYPSFPARHTLEMLNVLVTTVLVSLLTAAWDAAGAQHTLCQNSVIVSRCFFSTYGRSWCSIWSLVQWQIFFPKTKKYGNVWTSKAPAKSR